MWDTVMARRAWLRKSVGLGAALALPAARACEYFAPNLRVTHPWARATAEGDHFAVLNLKFDAVTQSDRLIGVATPVAATAVLHAADADGPIDLAIPAGQETLLAQDGVHVRLLGLQMALQVGRSYPLSLTLEKGGVIQATLNIDYQRFS
jgi:copper(I)-binding protein